MDTIIAKLKTDFNDIPAPKDFVNLVHKSLGALIKARRVYYTGKGYFLVMPENNLVTRQTWHDQFKQFASKSPQKSVDNSCQTEANIYRPHEQNGHTQTRQDHQLSPPALSPFYSTKQPHHSLSPPNVSPYKVSPRGMTERESPVYGGATSPPNTSNQNNSFNSEESQPESPRSPNANSANLERSQSFRMSKKSQKVTAKGGSLRLSKRDALAFQDDNGNTKHEETEVEQESESQNLKRWREQLYKIYYFDGKNR